MTDRGTEKRETIGIVGALVRLFAWSFGLAVIVATGWLVVSALMIDMPSEAAREVAAAPPRKCPPDLSIPPRAAGMPVDDVNGVRAGMTAGEAVETLKCLSEAYEVSMAVVGARTATAGAHPQLTATFADESIIAALYGPLGQERVGGVWQERFFDAGQGPAFTEVERALAEKYGAPHEVKDVGQGARELTWVYAPDGKALRQKAAPGSKTYLKDAVGYLAAGITTAVCVSKANLDAAAPPTWDPRCGLTIKAQIDPEFGPSSRVSRWRTVVYDQQATARQAGSIEGGKR